MVLLGTVACAGRPSPQTTPQVDVASRASGTNIAAQTTSPTAPVCSVKLLWDANTETDLAGYTIHRGAASGVYIQTITVGVMTSPTLTVESLACGTTHYFAARAFNTAGLYSGYSNELSIALPPAPSDGRKPAPINLRIGRP